MIFLLFATSVLHQVRYASGPVQFQTIRYINNVNEFENEKIISEFIGIFEYCDQSGDRVPNNNKKYQICSILSCNFVLPKVEKHGTLSRYNWSNV